MYNQEDMTKKEIYDAAAQYVEKNHSTTADDILQDAINIAITKAFIAGAKLVIEENICFRCKASKHCNRSIKNQCINFHLNIK